MRHAASFLLSSFLLDSTASSSSSLPMYPFSPFSTSRSETVELYSGVHGAASMPVRNGLDVAEAERACDPLRDLELCLLRLLLLLQFIPPLPPSLPAPSPAALPSCRASSLASSMELMGRWY